MISKLRKVSQLIFFLFFAVAFFIFPEVYGIYFLSIPYSIIFKLSLLSIIFIIFALIFGRAFCGWICPLGAIFDFLPSFRKAKDWNLKDIKFYIFLFLAITSLLFLFDPFSILTRLKLVYKFIPLSIFALLIVVVNFFSKRWFCRYLCPAGGLLGIFNKISLLKREINERCTDCLICEQKCSIVIDVHKNPRDINCTFCGDCIYSCPVNAISFKFAFPRVRKNKGDFKAERREFLKLTGVVAFGILFSKFTENQIPHRVLPPNISDVNKYIKKCIRCGLCVDKCPASILKIESMEPPYIKINKERYCLEDCNECGKVCPTDAIPHFSIGEKKNFKMGIAEINRNTCYTWTKHHFCDICYAKCPYDAIELKESFEVYVIEEKCTGCGACEAYCPNNSIPVKPITSSG